MSKLGNYISVQNGYAFKSKDFIKNLSGMPVIKIGNVTGGSFIDLSSYDTISEEIARKVKSFQTKDDDILIAMTGANVGKVSRIAKGTQPCLINQRVGRLILKEDCPYSSDFIYYLVSSNKSFQYFSNTADGAAQPNISGKLIEDLEFPDISPKSANKAGKHLKVLDEKIQLNTQINQTLEQIAQALFKSWFVDFDPVRAKVQALSEGMSLEQAELAAMQTISGKTPEELTALSQTQPDRYAELAETAKAFPCEMVEVDGGEVPKGWEKTTLSEICEMQNGYAFKSFDWMEQGIPVIKIGSVKPIIVEVEGNGFVSEDYSKLKPDFLLTSSDILVGLTGYVGEVGRIPTGKIAMLNQRVAKFLPKEIDKNHCFYNYIYCLARQSQFKEFAEINAKGSAQANISTKELLKFPIIKANDKLHILFENRVKELLERILWNSQNAETLAKTRDLLLPRLLNGEV
ncbi:TPA: restriction endonuclease subunit S [Haemophilus influenzae]|uniref:Putative type I restriction enzyme HindVIIP specificity protein n=1 Tax=Haemophilus influenzae (strain PittGG) TaxID=374931 RepID=A5UF30_HAEIG|nr:restriction endonuclease subunit S [Haemophilus influenzae]ABQ99385.1 putative type I restriction enzyme HindVIIP specificity protein [Haemophilus influenzae PittGG]MCK8789333.1 restriction endonuclease subunit S [Haemophilus influenzae]MCK8862889.1 restriction endonuclease subunit S [Haemophilus influenzae]MDO7264769.1 restriction endonuclease subunit S [Haemophilus influenzae]QFG55671.1 restriction endonuclease subunit S [Haemophilus influenzae]